MSLSHLKDPARGQRNLDALAGHLGDAFAELSAHLNKLLPRTADPDMALNNLERLLAGPAREQLPGLLENQAKGLDAVLKLLAVSQFFADTLVTYPDAVELIRTPPRRNPSTDELTAQLRADVEAAFDDGGVLRALRRFRQLQMLRVGVNDIIRDRPLEEITRDLARVADSSVKVALQTALRTVGRKYGTPTTTAGQPARVAAFAFGKLGGDELNYSSDIDLMFVYDEDGETTGKRAAGIPNAEFYSAVVADVVRLLSAHTDRGFAYRVDLRLRPEGSGGPLARSLASTLGYYDSRGRTWERQALIKLRRVAGDRDLGVEVLAALTPFVYRKYFSFSEINEVKALKRRMEQATAKAGADDLDVKTGRGGIRDIEFAVQFLQLLNGGDLPAVRHRNTLLAVEALELGGCLTSQETYILADAYRFLRKIEHRLQLLFDWQTHRLPTSADDLRKLALRMGYADPASGGRQPPVSSKPQQGADAPRSPGTEAVPLPAQRRSPLDESPEPVFDTRQLLLDPLELFLKDYHDKTKLDRAILEHLLHQTFGVTEGAEPEADLILAPDPDDATVRAALSRYPFRDIPAAYHNLNRLAQESVPFLSHRRCRHFLASIAPQLLRAIAETADPDAALNTLERVTASLGAKAVLYELFSFNPPTLKLFVDICANSPYLSAILMNNPGMEDELLDSLVLDQPRTADELRAELGELLRNASDPDPILRSFQDNEFLRVGVRDLLGKSGIRETTAALSDVADVLLNAVFDLTEPTVRRKLGDTDSPYCVLGLGKLGGRELSYHSDLDLIVLYESDGHTRRCPGCPDGFEPTTAHHYFTTLTQEAIKATSRTGPLGRLYEVDMRLRPTGKSGSLVLPLDEFRRYFAAGGGQLWERQALTRARPVRGDPAFGERVMAAVRGAVLQTPWTPALAADIVAMRERLEATASPRNLKRGRGGVVDVEFAVQLSQLRHGRDFPTILRPGVWDALSEMADVGVLTADQAKVLRDGYSFLRSVEARLRIVTDRALTELPESPEDMEKLARRCGFDAPELFRQELFRVRGDIRDVFRQITTG